MAFTHLSVDAYDNGRSLSTEARSVDASLVVSLHAIPCGEKNFYEGIETGDVYEIATTDPDAYPLPSFDLLDLQYYALHRVSSCIKAAGSLKTIFKGDPPNVDPVPGDITTVPSECGETFWNLPRKPPS
ncbi:hypothetical protein QBC46DRAFT_343131 [Diplogelasinospora grovesii]|uniref:Uncharacterized protein n=1 Tax=Diplogelasinospora grovesii TaxID=303347 RepID=A0AAN6S396_9PEZI|nr:hypothetical protein QBC46DRAFT_343131 [Diplogelasinospora grovesii]